MSKETQTTTNQGDTGASLDLAASPCSTIRRFRAKGGFECGTKYLEWDGYNMFIINKHGTKRHSFDYLLGSCEACVNQGVWEEF